MKIWKSKFGNLENLEHQTPEYPQRSNSLTHLHRYTVRKVSKDGVFLVRIFPYSDQMLKKYEPEKTPYLDTFHAVIQTPQGRILESNK